MNTQTILEELLALLERHGVEVRIAALGGGADALCKVKDKYIFFVDTDSDTVDTAAACARAMGQTVDIETVYLRPEVREFVQKYGFKSAEP
jgi:hypothetical protein